MTVLTLVRHGQTDWNLARRVQGRTDIPLNDTGRAQARQAAAALAGRDYRAIVASPLSRARETAEIIADALGLAAPRLYAGLVERDYGSAEGTEIVSHRALHLHAMTPDAESDESVAERAIAALRLAVADADRSGDPDLPIIAVAHGALIRVLIQVASGGEFPRVGDRIENGSQHDLRLTDAGLELLSFTTVPAETAPAEAMTAEA